MARSRSVRAVTLIEMLVALLILAFLVAATATFYNTIYRQQRQARGFSKGLTDLRSSLRTVTRVARHGFNVVASTTNFGNAASSSTQLIVSVPEPTGTTPSTVEIRFYVSNGVLYKQRSDEANPGVALTDGVSSVQFDYYQTVAAVRNTLPYTVDTVTTGIGAATEVLMTVTATRERISTKDSVLILFRNKGIGL